MSFSFGEELCTYLETKSLGTLGTDLFYQFMPDPSDITPDPITVVRETGGPENNAFTPWSQVGVQVVCRGTSYNIARRQAALIYNWFHGLTGVTLTDNKVLVCKAQGLPASIGMDQQRGRIEVSANYVFTIHGVTAETDTGSGAGSGFSKDPGTYIPSGQTAQ
jgi:hypothetical protein